MKITSSNKYFNVGNDDSLFCRKISQMETEVQQMETEMQQIEIELPQMETNLLQIKMRERVNLNWQRCVLDFWRRGLHLQQIPLDLWQFGSNLPSAIRQISADMQQTVNGFQAC